MIALRGWAATQSLYGVASDGVVHRSADGGITWTEQGSVQGEPEALHVDHRDGVDATVLGSTDGGASYTPATRDDIPLLCTPAVSTGGTVRLDPIQGPSPRDAACYRIPRPRRLPADGVPGRW
jgi:hypothetical protein